MELGDNMRKFFKVIRMIVVPFIIALCIYGLIRYFWLPVEKKAFTFNQITVEEYNDLFYNNEESIVFITKEDSEKKSEYEQNIRSKFDGMYVNVYYLDITNISDNELRSFESMMELEKGKYKLPMLVYTLNGDVYDKLEGYQEIHYLEDFINRNNIK